MTKEELAKAEHRKYMCPLLMIAQASQKVEKGVPMISPWCRKDTCAWYVGGRCAICIENDGHGEYNLPVNVGDILYAGGNTDYKNCYSDGIIECRVCHVHIRTDGAFRFQVSGYDHSGHITATWSEWRYLTDLGKNIWRTREEAEAKYREHLFRGIRGNKTIAMTGKEWEAEIRKANKSEEL